MVGRMDDKGQSMDENQASDRDLRIDVFMGDNARRYRATHIPSGVFAESDTVAEAVQTVNDGLEE